MSAITKKPYDPSKRPSSDRYPSGDKKPATAPTAVFRMREHGIRLGMDPRLGSVLGVMCVHRELSDIETAAGLKIAEIYGRYEMLQGMPRRTVASPSYERGFGAKDAIDTARMLPDEIKRHKRSVKKATEAFDDLHSWLTYEERSLIEQVCCENERIAFHEKKILRDALYRAAVKLKMAVEKPTVAAKKTIPRADDGALLAFAAIEALVHWFFKECGSKPTHFSLVDNKDWKKTRGITGSDGKYHYTIPVPLRSVALEQMDAKLRLACAQVGMLEVGNAETGEVN